MTITCMVRLDNSAMAQGSRVNSIKLLKDTLGMGLKEACQFYDGRNSVIVEMPSLPHVLTAIRDAFGDVMAFTITTYEFVPTNHHMGAHEIARLIDAERKRAGHV